jgi:hypothetical protein
MVPLSGTIGGSLIDFLQRSQRRAQAFKGLHILLCFLSLLRYMLLQA